MRVFKDKDLKYEIQTIDFERVEAGSTKELVLYLYNDSSAILEDLEFIVSGDKFLKIVKSPKRIAPFGVEELRIAWSPPLDLKRGLKAEIFIKGIGLYPP